MLITDDDAFAVLQEVLAGRLQVEPDARASKVIKDATLVEFEVLKTDLRVVNRIASLARMQPATHDAPRCPSGRTAESSGAPACFRVT